MKKNLVFQCKRRCATYGFDLHFVVAFDVAKALADITGDEERRNVAYQGVTYLKNDQCLVICGKRCLDHGLIGHELFHATHRIMEACHALFDPVYQEPFAYLNDWMHVFVHGELRKAGIRYP